MPIITRNIKGNQYMYFVQFDRLTNKKKETYCGLASDAKAKLKAQALQSEYVSRRAKYKKGLHQPAFAARLTTDLIFLELVKQSQSMGVTIKRNIPIGDNSTFKIRADFLITGIQIQAIVEVKVTGKESSLTRILGQIAVLKQLTNYRVLFVVLLDGIIRTQRIESLFKQYEGRNLHVLVQYVKESESANPKFIETLSKRILSELGKLS